MRVYTLILLSTFSLILPPSIAHIGEFDEVWQTRAIEAQKAAFEAYNPHPEKVANNLNQKVHKSIESPHRTPGENATSNSNNSDSKNEEDEQSNSENIEHNLEQHTFKNKWAARSNKKKQENNLEKDAHENEEDASSDSDKDAHESKKGTHSNKESKESNSEEHVRMSNKGPHSNEERKESDSENKTIDVAPKTNETWDGIQINLANDKNNLEKQVCKSEEDKNSNSENEEDNSKKHEDERKEGGNSDSEENLHRSVEGANEPKRNLLGTYEGPCLSTGPLGSCWRCQGNWAGNRLQLPDCFDNI